MEIKGYVRNDEIFYGAYGGYSEWMPARLTGERDISMCTWNDTYSSATQRLYGKHWFQVECTHSNGTGEILFSASRFYLRPSRRSRVSKAKLLLLIEAAKS